MCFEHILCCEKLSALSVLQELDHAVNLLTNDNLELACTVIEKTATDKAIREIDERLLPAYQVTPLAITLLFLFCDSCCCYLALFFFCKYGQSSEPIYTLL